MNLADHIAAETCPRNIVLLGHVLDVLAGLPDQSVQTVVTSPPYYGLRDYGIAPQVWGGAWDCKHSWGKELFAGEGYSDKSRKKWQHTGGRATMPAEGFDKQTSQGRFCGRCDAWLGSLGLEPSPALYLDHMVQVFHEVGRVLRNDGVIWVNLGDSYTPTADLEPKNLLGMPWRVAFALQHYGWILRSAIVWAKDNPMPESATDRPNKSHEFVFLLSKRGRYFYDAEAIKEPAESGQTRNARDVWTLPTAPFAAAHFATFPPELARRCILAGSPPLSCEQCGKPFKRQTSRAFKAQKGLADASARVKGLDRANRWAGYPRGTTDTTTLGWAASCHCEGAQGTPPIVLDIFMGAATVALACERQDRHWLGIEINPEYKRIGEERLAADRIARAEEKRLASLPPAMRNVPADLIPPSLWGDE